MSSSIAMPTSPSKTVDDTSSSSSSPSSYSDHSIPATPKQKSKPTQLKKSPPARTYLHERRPSLLSSAISKQECTVINIGDPDGPPRLISYLSSSQGFAWNPEIFLPSYLDCEYEPLDNRREPVIEIILSDEEVRRMMPQ